MTALLLKIRSSIIPERYATFAGVSDFDESVVDGLFELTGNAVFVSKSAKDHVFGCATDCLPMTIELVYSDGKHRRGWLAVMKFALAGHIRGENVYRITFNGSVKNHETPRP